VRASGRSRRPAWRPAPRAPLSLRLAPRMQPDRSGKCRQSEFPTIRAPATRWVDGPTRPEQLPRIFVLRKGPSPLHNLVPLSLIGTC
jgi:hypothetical protein